MKIETVALDTLVQNPFRDTWIPGENRAPAAFNTLVELLKLRAKIHDLPIHVGKHPSALSYMILDGHVAVDVYGAFGRSHVDVIVHPEITTEQEAIEFYIAANYLRSSGWLRSGVKLRNNLAAIGAHRATMLMPDAALANDLINRSQAQWEKYETVFIDPNEKENHEDALLG